MSPGRVTHLHQQSHSWMRTRRAAAGPAGPPQVPGGKGTGGGMLGTTGGFRLEGSPSATTTGSPWDPGAGDTPDPGCDEGGNTGTQGHGPLFAVPPSP